MRIGVVDAVHRDLLDVSAEELPRELLRALAVEAVPVRHLLARDPLLDEDALGHVRMDHIRHDQALVLGHEPGDQLRAVRLLDEVELGGEMCLELVRERLQLDEPGRLRVPLGEGGQGAQQLQVERDLLLDPRPPHLDDDLAARPEERAVDLRDRGARKRLLVEPGEGVQADVLVDDPASLRERERRHVVHQLAQLLDVDVRQEVRTGGEQLTELHEGRAELLEREPERPGALASRRLAADDADLAEHAQQPAAARDTADLERAPELQPHRLGLPGWKTPETSRSRCLRTDASSSRTETVPSNRSRTLPSGPTRKTHGSEGSFHCVTH